ncbi:hypothetical protein C8R41DRAFT_902915, partial [Lentinula lateritia]
MPPQRSAEELFEVDPDDHQRIICWPCRMHYNERSISKKSKSRHVRTSKHLGALDVWNIDKGDGPSTAKNNSMPTVETAMLSLPDRFKEQERSYISDFPPSTEHAPVYDVQKDSMGNYIDSDGNEIIFSAGPNLEDEQRARLQSLVRQMNALDLLPHHTSLNNFHDNNEEPDDELDDLMQF